ncbi:MAG: 5-deoxy-glucuronate isomerase [Meiothermus sp.]|uniref:5-deoxy-glucuronate isomerase n=1 Tax=Meiothermus sp. TaxID=1955249 RepID=UPI00298F3E72|nr:5-deoxy-glucuronate isomerase [Meiothermus sp.]MDW8481585.1 5-deoxy-glucuronate isomerase [Meiothermus sp.]
MSSPEGWGLTRHYSPERGYDQTYLVKDETLLSIPHGYHTYVSAPGYTGYYLWSWPATGGGRGTLRPRPGLGAENGRDDLGKDMNPKPSGPSCR